MEQEGVTMNKAKYKQPTYLVVARTEEEKVEYVNSSLCMIRDWRLGWFDVPHSMLEEFKRKFGTAGVEHSACDSEITKEEIEAFNLMRKGTTP